MLEERERATVYETVKQQLQAAAAAAVSAVAPTAPTDTSAQNGSASLQPREQVGAYSSQYYLSHT